MNLDRLAKMTAVLALALAACANPTLADLAVGQAAPTFSLTAVDGSTVSLDQFQGKTVVLEWMNPNCPFSLRHSDEKTMQKIADRGGDVVFLAVNSTKASHQDFLKPADYAKFLGEKSLTYPVLYDSDGKVGKAYGAKTTPHMYVIDPAGKIAYMGAIDDDPRGGNAKVNYVVSALDALAAGKSPDPASTKPYGCTVKY